MNIDTDRHVEETILERYALGTLSEQVVTAVEEHLLICEICQERAVEAESYTRAMRGAVAEMPVERPARSWDFAFLRPAFAICALLAIGVVTFRYLPGGHHGSPVPVALVAMRGSDVSAFAPSGRPLTLKPDLTGLTPAPAYHMQIVDGAGSPVWEGSLKSGAGSSVNVPELGTGLYFVRVSLASGQLLREYSLDLRRQN
ncbi:MAG TPA: hypothetical protein VHW24_17285 [Bryobacteraceae bacterium]|jgi:hypothetical protein|nr:hypothetical protein [Bryobacteraceae bacterium]